MKGHDHTVCEDYTLHGYLGNENNPYIILCDGCSSSKNSDFGARLLARACERALNNIAVFFGSFSSDNKYAAIYEYLERETLYFLRDSLSALAFPVDVSCATLLVSFVINEHSFVYARGDGTILIKELGAICNDSARINYLSGAPYYLAYELNPGMMSDYVSKYNMTVTFTELIHDIVPPHPFSYSKTYWRHGDSTLIDFILLSSDGIESFKPLDSTNVNGKALSDANAVLNRVSGFKSLNGEFVSRRMNAFSRDNNKSGIVHTDDVSVAAISRFVPEVST